MSEKQSKIERSAKDNAFVDFVVSVNRVTKVTKGGKRFSFAALVVSGDKQGNVAYALGKSNELNLAIAKATTRARKNLIAIPLRGTTIPYCVVGKHGASKVIIRPAAVGAGVIAGGGMRAVMKAAGIDNVLGKSLGSSNPQNVVKATLNALAKLRTARQLAVMRDMSVSRMVLGGDDASAQ
jgi:small subunit ribosomal protein S5